MNKKLTVTGAVLFILILASYPLKFIHFDDPYFGAYLSRQLQTMSTIDAYAAFGIDLMRPRTNFAGWPGFLVLECPLFQALAALVSGINRNPLVATRMLNLIFGTFSIFLVYRIGLFWFDRRVAGYSCLFFAWAPINIMFHRSTMIDISCVFFALASQLLLMNWLAKRRWWLTVLFCIMGTLCILIKPLYFLPVIVLFVIQLIQDLLPLSRQKLWASICRYWPIFVSLLLISGFLFYWLSLTQTMEADSGVFAHLGFSALLKPQYYLKFIHRFMVHYVTPFNALLFLLGIGLLLKKGKGISRIHLLATPILYYFLFANMNFPHSYYSLIMIPIFAIITGLGAKWLEEILQRENIVKNILISRLFIVGTSMVTCLLMFLHGWTSFMVLPQQRYVQMEEEVSKYLEPMNYATVYVNFQGNFSRTEILRNHPSNYLKSFFKNISDQKLRVRDGESPLIRSAVMYGLKQYGYMKYVDSVNDINVGKIVGEFNDELRYLIFYLFDEKKIIKEKVRPFGAQLIYESKDWIIYDLAKIE